MLINRAGGSIREHVKKKLAFLVDASAKAPKPPADIAILCF